MALTPADFELVRQHLMKFPQQQACPVCSSKSWSIAAIEQGNAVQGEGTFSLGGGVPVVTVVCETCFYVRQFAWRGITGQVARG